MNPAYFPALSALAGAVIGGLTSFGTAWSMQRTQLRYTHREAERAKLDALYSDFTTEASRLFGDALNRQDDNIPPICLALRHGRAHAPGIGPNSD